MLEPTIRNQTSMLNRALAEAGVYGIEVPVAIGDHVSTVATLVLGGFTERGLDDIRDYWYGNFAVIGLV